MTKSICLITGANSGIGYATSLQLAQHRAEVIMVCRNVNRGKQAQKRIIQETNNQNVHLLIADLSNQGDIQSLVATVKKQFQPLNVLI